MSSATTLTTFTSAATEANKHRQTKPVRTDYRVIFANKVRYHQDQVWERDYEGTIVVGKNGGRMYTMVKDKERMIGAPRKIFNSHREYESWRDRDQTESVDDIDIEEFPELGEQNTHLVAE